MSTVDSPTNALQAFQWEPQPAAERLVRELVGEFVSRNRFAKSFGERLYAEAGVRFLDMVDHIAAPANDRLHEQLIAAGFKRDPMAERSTVAFSHPGGMFPTISLTDSTDVDETRIAVKVEFIDDFMAAWDIQPSTNLRGAPTAPMRRLLISADAGAELYAIERHGFRRLEPPKWSAEKTALVCTTASSSARDVVSSATTRRRRSRTLTG